MTHFFVSDLHLDACRPAATQCFINFLNSDARTADRLYVLGDLFEHWIGDDDPNPLHVQIATAIKNLSDSGTHCYFMAGNRDFLIGQKFLDACGLIPLFDPSLIYVAGTSVLISHGDLYCTDDIGYQRYRRVVHNPVTRKIYDALPFSLRSKIVSGIRGNSQNSIERKEPQIMDVNQSAIEQALCEHDVSTLLHGHTHRPDIHDFSLRGRPARRIVLSDWYKKGSVLRWDKSGPQLVDLPFETA